EWFRDRQRAAWKQFESLPNPTRKDQTWRFSNVGLLDLAKFKVGGTLTEEERDAILERSRGLDEVAGRMVFAGDQLIERDVISDQLKKRGVIFQSLERAMVEHADLFRKHFMSQPATLGSARFAALHQALVSSGTFLYVPHGVEIELPVKFSLCLNARTVGVFHTWLRLRAKRRKGPGSGHSGPSEPKSRALLRGWNILAAAPARKRTK